MSKPELQRLLDLQSFLQKFNEIDRAFYHPGSKTRHETDTEHSFSLSMAAWFLAPHFPKLKVDEIIKMALVHDLVEIYAGDTYIFADKTVLDTKAQRELEAYKRIKQEWPDFPDMLKMIDAYEKLETPESKFVYALDKLMPIFMIFLGEGYTWQKKKITLEMLLESKTNKVELSPEINDYYTQLISLLKDNKHYFS
ncbi:MAG TPA: HD domain-containing protein [Candidatus Binatia bacterium]|nr:HD domain-containing protein [Candidatus Binatia bacterium]